MACIYFVDFTRECSENIEELPSDTFMFCATDNYINCPFFKLLNKSCDCCENIQKCKAYSLFKTKNFSEFLVITEKYCLSGKKILCARYILKKSGKEVPLDLHPDGGKIKTYEG